MKTEDDISRILKDFDHMTTADIVKELLATPGEPPQPPFDPSLNDKIIEKIKADLAPELCPLVEYNFLYRLDELGVLKDLEWIYLLRVMSTAEVVLESQGTILEDTYWSTWFREIHDVNAAFEYMLSLLDNPPPFDTIEEVAVLPGIPQAVWKIIEKEGWDKDRLYELLEAYPAL